MRKLWVTAIVVVGGLGLGNASLALGQSIPSSKAAVAVSSSVLLRDTYNAWTPILTTAIKMPEQKDLFIGVSLVTSLFTQTMVRSRGGNQDASSAEAVARGRGVVDPGTAAERIAAPGHGVYDRR